MVIVAADRGALAAAALRLAGLLAGVMEAAAERAVAALVVEVALPVMQARAGAEARRLGLGTQMAHLAQAVLVVAVAADLMVAAVVVAVLVYLDKESTGPEAQRVQQMGQQGRRAMAGLAESEGLAMLEDCTGLGLLALAQLRSLAAGRGQSELFGRVICANTHQRERATSED